MYKACISISILSKLRRGGLVVSVSASHVVCCGFASYQIPS